MNRNDFEFIDSVNFQACWWFTVENIKVSSLKVVYLFDSNVCLYCLRLLITLFLVCTLYCLALLFAFFIVCLFCFPPLFASIACLYCLPLLLASIACLFCLPLLFAYWFAFSIVRLYCLPLLFCLYCWPLSNVSLYCLGSVQVVCGQDHTLFLTEDGQVYSCGLGADGQTGMWTTLNIYMWQFQ